MNKRLALILLGCVITGCGRSDLPDLGTVSGVVTLNGVPLADAIVNFTPTGEGRPSTAETDGEGKYSLIYLQGVDGAIVGGHSVTVERLTTPEMDDLPDDPAEMTDEQKALLEKFAPLPASAGDGTIQKEVKAGDNQINIEL